MNEVKPIPDVTKMSDANLIVSYQEVDAMLMSGQQLGVEDAVLYMNAYKELKRRGIHP